MAKQEKLNQTLDDRLNDWDSIVGNYLKAEHLDGKKGEFIVTDVKIVDKNDGKSTISLFTEIKGVNWEFMLNWTNLSAVKEKVKSPAELRGKTIHWEKVRVQNPQTKVMQDGISITAVED